MKNFTLKRFILTALAVFAMVALAMVVIFFIKKKKASSKAEKEAHKKRDEVLMQHGGTLPPIIVYPPAPVTGGPAPPPAPVEVVKIPAHIEKLCWMANDCSKTGGTSEYRCEICNNLKSLGDFDIALWAETYRVWYGSTLKDDLGKSAFFDCGCIFWSFSGCSCTKPNLDRLP